MSTTPKNKQRFLILDVIRGIGVILMIIFHFCYDLSSIGVISIKETNFFWYLFPRIVVFIFFSISGFTRGINELTNEWKNITKLALSSLIVSLGTYFLFPNQWIYFGTLHSLCFAHLMVNKRGRAFILPILIIAYLSSEYWGPVYISSWNQSFDHIRVYPWFGVFLIFLLIARKMSNKKKTFLQLESIKLPWRFFALCGRNALMIYLAHRPIGIGIVKLFEYLW